MARMKKVDRDRKIAIAEMSAKFQEAALFVSIVPFKFPEVAVEARPAYDALVKLAEAVAAVGAGTKKAEV